MKNHRFTAAAILLLSVSLMGFSKTSHLRVDQVYCNNRINPIGIEGNPQFRWTVVSAKNNAEVVGYEIRIDNKTMKSEDLGMLSLESGKKYEWQVRVKDPSGDYSPWSRKAWFVTGLTDDRWTAAKWIALESMPDSLKLVPGVHGSGDKLGNLAVKRPAIPIFRKNITISKTVTEATLFLTGLGQYTLELDGEDLTGGFMRPGWTNYAKSCFYNGYDLTRQLKKGAHQLQVTVGNGFFNINRERYRKLVTAWGMPMMRAILIIRYSDGRAERICSDQTWQTAPSPITYTSIYGGEDFDARLKPQNWQPAIIVKGPGGAMRCEEDYPLTVRTIFQPAKITGLPDGSWVYDFGQNASGIPEMVTTAANGQKIRLTPGELIDDHGQVTQQASGGPHYYEYTSDGTAHALWKPRFSYYGMRYVCLTGGVPAGKPNPNHLPVVENMTFLHTANSSPVSGSFTCSNELFNKIFHLIDWSVRSNLASVTTDCPHREKLGWLEVTHLMGNSIRYNYDIHNLYAKIVNDMIESQLDNGLVPDIAPEFVPFAGGFRDSPEWGSSAVIIPWYLYQWYGDSEPMKRAYPMMKKYVQYLGSKAKEGIVSHGLGDWFDLGPQSPGPSQLTPMALTATAIYYYDLVTLAQMATILGYPDDAQVLTDSAQTVKTAFNNRFYDPDTHVIATGSQTAYSMPLVVGLVPENDRAEVFKNLIRAVERDHFALTAGDVGYHYLVQALQDAGASDVIYQMNSRDDVPGYGFQLKNGATALTESWPALRYVSNNHMMLGHLMEWLYSGLGGIRPAEGSVGFEKIIIDPQPVGDLTWADATHRCILGDIHCRWEKSDAGYTLDVQIPVGATAQVFLKGKPLGQVGSGKYHFETQL